MEALTVVVATDFSKSSEEALALARTLARRYGAALHVVHVVEDVSASYYGVDGPLPDLESLQQTAENDARAELDVLVTADDRRDLAAEGVVLSSNQVARALVDYARTVDAIVLVLGTHGRTGLAHFFIGSVAERVVRTAECPVLTVRQSTQRARPVALADMAAHVAG